MDIPSVWMVGSRVPGAMWCAQRSNQAAALCASITEVTHVVELMRKDALFGMAEFYVSPQHAPSQATTSQALNFLGSAHGVLGKPVVRAAVYTRKALRKG